MRLKIGLDLDDTVCYWSREYFRIFRSKKDKDIKDTLQNMLKKNRKFWVELPLKHMPDFEVALICTKRICPKSYSREYLRRHGINDAPIYQVTNYYDKKSRFIKGRCDVFVDNDVSNFLELNSNGVPCLLITDESNTGYDTPHRISSLSYDEIENAYERLMKDTISLSHRVRRKRHKINQ